MTRPEPASRLAAVVLLAVAGARRHCRAPRRRREHAIEPQDWSFGGLHRRTTTRRSCSAASRSIQQVCSACHGLKRVRFRNLAEPGGPEFPVEAVKALAAAWPYQISGELDDEGNPIDRLPGLADPIIGPYKNDKEARAAQNGALPPDLSLIVRARTLESHAPWYTPLAAHAVGHRQRAPGRRRRLRLRAADRLSRTPPAGVEMNEACTTTSSSPAIRWRCRRPCRRTASSSISPTPAPKPRSSRTRKRRDGLPRLGGRPEPRCAQAARLAGAVLSADHDAAALHRQEAHLGPR